MIVYDSQSIHWSGDRPESVGEQVLASPVSVARTPGGFWGLYACGQGEAIVVFPEGAARGRAHEIGQMLLAIVGDDDRGEQDRHIARNLLALVGGGGG